MAVRLRYGKVLWSQRVQRKPTISVEGSNTLKTWPSAHFVGLCLDPEANILQLAGQVSSFGSGEGTSPSNVASEQHEIAFCYSSCSSRLNDVCVWNAAAHVRALGLLIPILQSTRCEPTHTEGNQHCVASTHVPFSPTTAKKGPLALPRPQSLGSHNVNCRDI